MFLLQKLACQDSSVPPGRAAAAGCFGSAKDNAARCSWFRLLLVERRRRHARVKRIECPSPSAARTHAPAAQGADALCVGAHAAAELVERLSP